MAEENFTINGEDVSQIRERAREAYNLAYDYTAPHFVEIQKLLNAYKGKVDRNKWPTLSNIINPHHFTYVQQELPFLIEYLFPDGDFLELTPVEEAMEGATVRSVERYYEHVIRDVMKLKKNAFNAIQDAVKTNVGYLMVEPIYVNPMTKVTRTGRVGNDIAAQSVGIERSQKTRVQLSASYVPIGQVFPMGDGETPENGQHVVVRFRTAEELRNLKLSDDLRVKNGEDKTFHADVEELLEDAKDGNLDSSYHSLSSIILNMRKDINQASKAPDKKRTHTEPLVPVVEVYLRNEHIWLANGDKVIRHIKDDSGLLSPLVKFTPCKDSGEWFPYGKAQAGESLSRGINVFNNAIMDLMNYSLAPARVVNTAQMKDGQVPKHGPHVTYRILNGDARQAVSFTTPPQLPQGAFEMSNVLANSYDQTKGQPAQLQGQGAAGLVRGGSAAFESLMATPHGRMKLAGALLEMDGLEETVERVITYSAAVIDDVESFVVTRGAESGDGFAEREYEMMKVRPEDLRNVFRMSLNLREKMRNSTADVSFKMAMLNVLSQDPRIDQDGLLEWVIGDRRLVDNLKATPQQIQENLQLMQAQQEAISTPADQAQAGREAQGVG